MKKYFYLLVLIANVSLLSFTSPMELNAPALLIAILFLGVSLLLFLNKLMLKIQNHRQEASSENFKLNNFAVPGLVLVFLFFLNTLNALTTRDVILAVIMAFIANFYINRYSNKIATTTT